MDQIRVKSYQENREVMMRLGLDWSLAPYSNNLTESEDTVRFMGIDSSFFSADKLSEIPPTLILAAYAWLSVWYTFIEALRDIFSRLSHIIPSSLF